MSDGNGDFARALPPRLDAALRAARDGHHVSYEALRAAVCVYVDELIASGHADDEIRMHLLEAFATVNIETHTKPAAWNDQRIDELIAGCRERLT
jgi:hypothetical protein